MPRLASLNKLIPRNEAMHSEFLVVLYSILQKKIQKKKIVAIIKEAVAPWQMRYMAASLQLCSEA